MKTSLISKAKRHLWRRFFRNGRLSYAQSGEDLLLDTIFNSKPDGVYVDVGANNPYVQSNTKFFYDKGWSGINIDALPGSMKVFNKARPKDVNLEAAIAGDGGEAVYHMFQNSLYNTFDGQKADEAKQHSRYLGAQKIKTTRLSELLRDQNVTAIDFLTIDVEGHELGVLGSNDWAAFRPKAIVVECFPKEMRNLEQSPVFRYLNGVNYTFFCNTVTNAIYLENSYLNERFPDL